MSKPQINMYNVDCMEFMKSKPDNYYSLAIVDPPYGGANTNWDNKKNGRFGGILKKYKIERTGGTWGKKYNKKIKTWDIAPDDEYFLELIRVSRHQIIWGGNYFNLPPSNNFIIWRKLTISESFSMAMAEYAWTNIKGNAKVFEYAPQDKYRHHPTQKPVALYKWLLKLYANNQDIILDTHGGSGSLCLACWEFGINLDWCEIDKDYYIKAVNRFNNYKKQGLLFYE